MEKLPSTMKKVLPESRLELRCHVGQIWEKAIKIKLSSPLHRVLSFQDLPHTPLRIFQRNVIVMDCLLPNIP